MTDRDIEPVGLGHNNPPEPTPFEAISAEIEDLYGEAKNWADGQPIENQDQHDAVERLHDLLHDAGKRAESARVEEKKPLDDQIAEIQARYNTLIGNTKSIKGKVVLGKEALLAVLTPWRKKIADEKEAAAKAAREEADRIAKEAQDAIRASRGDLEAREKAEELLQEAKTVERDAKRADKAASTGTGLRTIWHADLVDEAAALDWAYSKAQGRFLDLVQSLASEAVRSGAREIPGFKVWDEKVAR